MKFQFLGLFLFLFFFSNSFWGAVSWEESPHAVHLQVFPNPSSDGMFTVELKGVEDLGEVNLMVFNLIGEKVYQEKIYHSFSSFERKIDLSSLSEGIYLLEIMHKGSKQIRRLAYK